MTSRLNLKLKIKNSIIRKVYEISEIMRNINTQYSARF